MHDADVVIVGAGPAGSACATLLARAGARVVLLDRAAFPRRKPCAECLSVEAQRQLESLGALDEAKAAGVALHGMRIRAPGGAVIRGEYRAVGDHAPVSESGLAVRREVLDALLLERAREAGAQVEIPAHVVDVERDAHGRATGVRLGGGESSRVIRAPLVVGADGLRSVVARRTGAAPGNGRPARIALVSHVENVGGVDDWGELHVERDGFVGIADVGAGLTTVALVLPAHRAREIRGDAAGFTRAWLAAHPHLAPRFANARIRGDVLATGPFAQRARKAWSPGAMLVGDAADFFDPFTGEGIYTALRGAELASRRALEYLGGANDDPLRAYADDRRREFSGKWTVERLIAMTVGSPRLMDRAASTLAKRPDLAALLVGVTNHYVPAREVLGPRFLAALFLHPALHPMLPLHDRMPTAPARLAS